MFKFLPNLNWLNALVGPSKWRAWACWLGALSLAAPLAPVRAQPQSAAPAAAPSATQLRQRLAAAATDTSRGQALHALSGFYLFSQFDSAWTYANRAQELARRAGDQRGLFSAYGHLSILNSMRGHDEAALRLLLAQLRLADQVPGKARAKPAIYSNMATSYLATGRYDQAQAMYEQARLLDELARDTAGIVTDYINLANVLDERGRPAQALVAAGQGLRLRRQLRPADPARATFSLDLTVASALLKLGRPAAARDTLVALLPRLRQQNNGRYLAYAYAYLLTAYARLDQLPAAEQAGQAALTYARQSGETKLQRDALETLAEVAARQGDYAEAYRRRGAQAGLMDSLARQSNAKTLQDMQFRYDTERREAQLRELAQESDQRRWQMLLWAGLAGLALLALGLVYLAKRLQTNVFARRESLLTQERERSEALQLLREATTQALQLELDTNQREMTSATLFAQQKTKLLEDLTARLEALSQRVPEPEREAVAELKKAIRQHLQVGDDWERITLHFGKIHPSFFEQLRRQCPALTPNELKQCAYVKLNLTNKDIANLVNIEPNSVKIAQYRIKKKLGLPEESSLREYILSV